MPSPSSDSTEQYAHAAVLGDMEALGELFELHADKLRRYLQVRTTDPSLADDIAQDTWVRVARTIHSFDASRGSFQAWLFSIARNLLADHFRSPSRRERVTGEMLMFDRPTGDNADEQTSQRLASARLATEIQALPRSQRSCVIHRFYTGLTLAETADLMGRNVNTIKQLQHRACRQLAKRLGAEAGDLLSAFTPADLIASTTRKESV